MALGSFVAGRATGSYDPPGAPAAADIGLTEEGYTVSAQHALELVERSDGHGAQAIEGIWQGLTNVQISGRFLEWKNAVLSLLYPYGAVVTATGASYLGPGVIGRLATAVAGALVLSAVAGTPAAATPASLTALFASVAENFPVEWALDSRLRRTNFRLRVWPYDDAGITKYIAFT